MAGYDCSSPVGEHTWQPRRAWLRLALLVPVVLSLLGMAGCATTTYDCAKGCFSGAVLSKANFGLPGTPWAASSKMWVAPITCDATCRASSGDPNNPGQISTFVLLGKGQYAIAVGYGTDTAGDAQFFVDTYLPESPYTRRWLGKTGVTQSADKYYVQVILYAYTPLLSGCAPPSYYWEVGLKFPPNSPQGYGQLGDVVSTCSSFAPDSLVLGAYLVGKSGGSASSVFRDTEYNLSPSSFFSGLGFNPLTADGAVSANGPPFVGWYTPPSKVPGGTFVTRCCV